MIEAMKQALEALENNRRTHYYCEDTWYSCPKHEEGCANDSDGDECNCGADKANAEIDAAITSLRQAIEQAEKLEPLAMQMDVIVVNLVREGINKHRARELAEHFVKHTHPPKREWVGLTDEDIEKLAVENGQATFLNDDEETGIIWFDGDATPFAQAIEAKLKEKNT